MNRRSLNRIWVFCLAALMALVSTATIAATTVPLRATIVFDEILGNPIPGCSLTGVIDGGGTAGKLGAVRMKSTDCINQLSATKFLFVSDEVVLEFANGDQIWAAYGGTLSVTDGAIRGSYFIFGGTGAFADARGFGTIEGVESIATGEGQVQLKGTLTY